MFDARHTVAAAWFSVMCYGVRVVTKLRNEGISPQVPIVSYRDFNIPIIGLDCGRGQVVTNW